MLVSKLKVFGATVFITSCLLCGVVSASHITKDKIKSTRATSLKIGETVDVDVVPSESSTANSGKTAC